MRANKSKFYFYTQLKVFYTFIFHAERTCFYVQITTSVKKSSNFIFLIIGTAWMFDAMDVGLLSYIMPLIHTHWQLTDTQTGLASSISSIGMIFGGFLFGRLADQFGRSKTLIWSLLVFSIGNAILALSPNFSIFLLIRFIVGMGLGGELPVAATYIADLYTTDQRSKMLILADSFWAVGWLVAAALSFFLSPVLGWRGLLILTSLSAFFALVLRKHIQDNTSSKTSNKVSPKISLKEVFNWQTPLLWLAWFMVMFSYYGMFMWLPSILAARGNDVVAGFGYSIIIVVAQLPGYFLAAWLSSKIQVRYVFVIYMLGTAIGAIWFGQVTGQISTILAGCLLSFFNLGAYGAIIALTPQLYPSQVRGTMTGLAQGIGRIGAVVGPLLVGILMDIQISINTIFIIFMLSLIIGALCILAINEKQAQELKNE